MLYGSPERRLYPVLYSKPICFSFLENLLKRRYWTKLVLMNDNNACCILRGIEHKLLSSSGSNYRVIQGWEHQLLHKLSQPYIPGAAHRERSEQIWAPSSGTTCFKQIIINYWEVSFARHGRNAVFKKSSLWPSWLVLLIFISWITETHTNLPGPNHNACKRSCLGSFTLLLGDSLPVHLQGLE